MKVLLATYEATPIYKVGGLGDVAGSLPQALKKLGVDIRLVLPGYKFIKKPPFLPGSEIPVYYLSHPKYFQKEHLDLTEKESREQFIWFSRQILESLPSWDFWPDVIHLNDWHTALVTTILKNNFSQNGQYANISTLLTIHNLAYQGIADLKMAKIGGLTKTQVHPVDRGCFNFLKEGIISADALNTVSPTYALQVLTSEFGNGLEKILNKKPVKIVGILNGVDYQIWDPRRGHNLPYSYNLAAWREGKKKNKAILEKRLNLKPENRPLLGIITRLSEQKGLDLLLAKNGKQSLLEEILDLGCNLVILGEGEKTYVQKLSLLEGKLAKRQNFRFLNLFDDKLAHLIYAASDLFLMPSRFEPCGLVQLIAMRYGSLPLVHRTGGLADTVRDRITGFSFKRYNRQDFFRCLKSALNFYPSKRWEKMVEKGMEADFSWGKSARQYLRLYKKITRSKKYGKM